MNDRYRGRRLAVVLVSLLAIGGCQSLPTGPGAGIVTERTMPGELSRELYAPQVLAVAALNRALSAENVSLEGIPLDDTLATRLPAAASLGVDASGDTVRRLAETEFLGDGPYRLVRADLRGERLEYRSERTAMHVSVSLRAPTERERADGDAFIVTDLFGQESLAERVRTRVAGAGEPMPVRVSSAGYPAISPIGWLAEEDDAGRLAYLDSLPPVERDRDDLLGLRALLRLRLGQDEAAGALVRQGIVRYPTSPVYFVLASVLFERADRGDAELPASLLSVMDIRFTTREILDTRAAVGRFLGEGAGFVDAGRASLDRHRRSSRTILNSWER